MSDTKTQAPGPTPGATSSIEDQIRLREGKAAELRAKGGHPYGNGVAVPHTTGGIRAKYDARDAASLEAEQTHAYAVAGRVMAARPMGKVTFLSLRDRDGDLQVFLRKDKVGDAAWEELKLLDLGDIAYACGRVMRTRAGELSIAAGEYGKSGAGEQPNPTLPGFKLLTKSLRPLPEKWHGLTDVETRYRRRYIDLAVNPEVREIFRRRARLITALRRFLDERSFVEVETPILHKPEEAGGAAARPFATHHNALDLDLKLRIATELHLKRLIVGGLERVYEIGRIFRNEGIDRRHNPEFTSVEFYLAYATHEDLMTLTEEMVQALAVAVSGGTRLPYQGVDIDYAAPWPRVSMVGEVARMLAPETAQAPIAAQMEALSKLPAQVWEAAAPGKDEKKKLEHAHALGARIAWAFEAICEARLPAEKPCFVIDFPLEVSPLARKRDSDPRLVDRFEAYAGGMEIANAFSELNDPRDQEARFRAQVEAAARGDVEAMPYDHDFIRALEHGMPPTAGEGVGIDRLAMLFTDSASIREVVLFPLLKPLAADESGEGEERGDDAGGVGPAPAAGEASSPGPAAPAGRAK
jgi:lysyl-tRNA synthetase, class II